MKILDGGMIDRPREIALIYREAVRQVRDRIITG